MDRTEQREREKMYACWLCSFPDIGNRQLHRLSELCGGPEGVYFADRDKWGQILTSGQAERLAGYREKWEPEAKFQEMRAQGIELILLSEEGYPERLREIPDAPYGIFVRGRLPAEDAPAVAVIGARECSEYGKYVARELGAALGRHGVAVISGMAKGIDGISQEAALDAGGISLGVLGCGVDVCYPAQNRALYERLSEKGGLLSTYPGGTPARPQNFPPRNRIVSGMADAVVVVEARVKSGTLITVDMALEQGREVYVVPGRVTDRLSDGCNRLMKQGAGVFLSPESFFDEIRKIRENRKKGAIKHNNIRNVKSTTMKAAQENNTPKPPERLCRELTEVYGVLDFYPKTLEEIRQALSEQYQDKQIISYVMQLCMEELAVQVSPGQFCLRGQP